GEQPLQAAERELTEETGLKAALFTPVLEMQLSNSATDEISISYVATGLSHGPSSPEVDEKLEVKKIHFDELVDMVERGEIKDALSVATILRVHLLKAKGQLDRF
ncbi:MAG: NUDIX hydrolase, partial [Saprospiraceae bacterium]|nr:NUDIX hydrolase [Saprospiraceae bacterium]